VVDDLRTDNPFMEASADLRLNNQDDGPDIFHSVMVRALLEGQNLAPILLRASRSPWGTDVATLNPPINLGGYSFRPIATIMSAAWATSSSRGNRPM